MAKNYKEIEQAEAAANELWSKAYEPEEVKEELPEGEPKPPEVKEPAPTEVVEEGIQVKEVTPEPEAPKEEAPKEVKAEPEKDYKQMYKTLEGKYRVEVPELHKMLKHWKDNALQLSDRISELEKKISDTETAASHSELDSDLNALENEYPEVGKVVKKLNEMHSREIKSIHDSYRTQLDERMAPVHADLMNTREARFDSEMTRYGVPDWREIDTDPGFIEFLNVPAPYGRKTKLELLREAGQMYDSEVASKLFLEYKNSLTPAEQPDVGQKKLEKYVAPPKPETGANSKGGSGKPELTVAMYEKFYRETSKPGRYNPKNWFGKSEAEMEAMLEAALIKGELRR